MSVSVCLVLSACSIVHFTLVIFYLFFSSFVSIVSRPSDIFFICIPPSLSPSLFCSSVFSLFCLSLRLPFLSPPAQNNSLFFLFSVFSPPLSSLPSLLLFLFSPFISPLPEHSPHTVLLSCKSTFYFPFFFFTGSRIGLFSLSSMLFSSNFTADNGAGAPAACGASAATKA